MLDLTNVMARDMNDRIILWNTGMEKMYGWTRTEALGRISNELFHTEFAQPLEKIRAAFDQGLFTKHCLMLRAHDLGFRDVIEETRTFGAAGCPAAATWR